MHPIAKVSSIYRMHYGINIQKKNTEFAGNKNSNNSSTVVQHIYSHAVENEAKNVITELTLDTDNNVIFDFPELDQQENASALIDPLISRHTANDLSKQIHISSKCTFSLY